MNIRELNTIQTQEKLNRVFAIDEKAAVDRIINIQLEHKMGSLLIS